MAMEIQVAENHGRQQHTKLIHLINKDLQGGYRLFELNYTQIRHYNQASGMGKYTIKVAKA